jgi:hypothetical protein
MTDAATTPASSRLRAACLHALADLKRPISAHEVERWVEEHDRALWNDISQKCYDYVRIILSLTSDGTSVKYKSLIGVSGVDPRASFYGLSNTTYDPTQWKLINRIRRKSPPDVGPPRREKSRATSEESSPPAVADEDASPAVPAVSAAVPQAPSPPKDPVRTHNLSDRAWFALTSVVPAKDAFWTVFMAALDSIKNRVEAGWEPAAIVQELMTENPRLKDPTVAEQVKSILTREANLKRRLMIVASGPDDLN